METTVDKFLGGRIVCAQPKTGFRAGHDTVLLAAAVPARAGDRILELGAGAGIASLCLAARVPDCEITGIEIDPELVALANANAKRNGMADRVRFVEGDVLNLDIPDGPFDRVFSNPPFHRADGQVSPSPERDRAKRARDLIGWTVRTAANAAQDGTVTLIVHAGGSFEDILTAIDGFETPYEITILPLLPRAGEAPKRAIAQLRRTSRGEERELEGFVLHQPDGKPTEEAEAVLRHAGALRL